VFLLKTFLELAELELPELPAEFKKNLAEYRM